MNIYLNVYLNIEIVNTQTHTISDVRIMICNLMTIYYCLGKMANWPELNNINTG